jgi:uncharacterized membrane protein YkvA (DUF1232 family)
MTEPLVEFRRYVEELPRDVREILQLAEDAAVPKSLRKGAVGALNYVLLNLDIVPDWVPVIGLFDDAAILRVAMELMADEDAPGVPTLRLAVIARLSNDADVVKDFLGADLYDRLRNYVAGLATREVQGRTPDAILRDTRHFAEWKRDVEGFLKAFRPDLRAMQDPGKLARDLRAYFQSKLAKV